MNRRQMLKNLSAFGLVAATGFPAVLKAKEQNKPISKTALSNKMTFDKALTQNPKLIGYTGVKHDLNADQLTSEGRLPKDISGKLYRNGPARLERGDMRYQHLFEGDGMVQEFTLANGTVSHRGRFITTPKFQQEQAAETFLFSGPDTKLSHSQAITKSDDINVANTSVLSVCEDLWALWEAGSAPKLNKNSLEFTGHVKQGEGTSSERTLKGMPFSAHPKVSPNGDIWNFGYNASGHIILYHLNSKGSLNKFNVIQSHYTGGMLHDFLITENHILLILPSVSNTAGRDKSLFKNLHYKREQAMRVLIVDKHHLEIQRQYELDPGFVFHFGNAWEDAQGNIRFDASLYPSLDVLYKMHNFMSGQLTNEQVNAQPTLITLYKNGKVHKESINITSEFPKVLPQRTGLKYQHLYFLSCGKTATWKDSVCQLNIESGDIQQFHYGDDFIVEEHVPYSPTGDENSTYLIGTALHVPSKRTCLNVFDANRLGNGPIYRAWLPYYLPLGFHGQFVPT